MNKDQLVAVLRQILTFGGGFLASRYAIDGATMSSVVGGIVALVSIGFDIRNNSNSQTIQAANKLGPQTGKN